MFEHLDIKADTELNLLEAITIDIKAIIAKGTPKSVPKPKASQSIKTLTMNKRKGQVNYDWLAPIFLTRRNDKSDYTLNRPE